ncbi:hypothetical protein H257_03948 [Aphanomyces astaci]|uniref:Tc1-like transposase DDE domain-containing protein n=1 Tax=Aphanomyces astaci TaxID=112090 RepID=W4GTU6_APHAT|nr:hypothetical protein H257_03948 [Aphanomyces astaci]ETV83145.1 hypothetical protein H257_03948 [Aphanomyces astaci]|eukprot:XP_009826575.1 hypothetical protein H257_03948 [Aphanomyces astaci]
MQCKESNPAGAQSKVKKSVSEFLGFGQSTIGRAIAEWRKNHDPSFEASQRVRLSNRRSPADHLTTELGDIIAAANQQCLPVSAESLSKTTGRRARGDRKTRFYLAESEGNVAFRAKNIRKKLANPGVVGTKNSVLFGEWVNGSIFTWLFLRKSKRKRAVVADVETMTILGTLQARFSRTDGACYHKRITNPCAKVSSRWADIPAWLAAKGIDVDPKLTKAELLVMIKTSRDGPRYAPQLIATEYGHTMYYTPPYHHELQPIEIIWGIVKQ